MSFRRDWIWLMAIAACGGTLTLLGIAQAQTKYSVASFLRCTRDMPILEAFHLMSESPNSEPSLALIVNQPTRVFFKNLAELNKKVRDYDALSWLSSDGQQVIFINHKHQNAPPEALAAIIAHEAIHNDAENSVQEEIAGWETEARVWNEMTRLNPKMAEIAPGQYPLVDRLNQLSAALDDGTLPQLVRNNAGYTGLPEHSTGF